MDGILEYSRVVFELQPIGAGISVQVQSNKGNKLLSSWDQKDQSVTCISKAFESLAQSDSEPSDVESAIPVIVDSILNDVSHQFRAKSELRIVVLIHPSTSGFCEDDILAQDCRLNEIFDSYVKTIIRASDCDLRFNIIWVLETTKLTSPIVTGSEVNFGTATVCAPGNLKSMMCQLVQKHFHLQLIRVTNIPMSKADADKSKDSKKETLVETVDLLSCGGVGDTAELILVWEREGTISKAFDKGNQSYDAYPAMSIRKTTAMALTAKPTQTLLKHLTKKPATLLAARRPGASSSSLPKSSGAGRLPSGLWLLRDHGSAILLTQLHLADPLLRLPLPSLPVAPYPAAAPDSPSLDVRLRELLKAGTIPISEREVADVTRELGAPPREALLDVPLAVPWLGMGGPGAGPCFITMAPIERRTRYLPLGDKSALYRCVMVGPLVGPLSVRSALYPLSHYRCGNVGPLVGPLSVRADLWPSICAETSAL